MKTKSIAVLLTFSFLLLSFGNAFSQARAKKKAMRDMDEYRYEIECVGIGVQGTYLIKVWSYSKKQTVAINQAKKNAIHGVIFKGFAGAGSGCTSQKALATSAIEDEKIDFFEGFFNDGGDFSKYVALSNDGTIDPEDRVKVGREYKIGVVVSVMKDKLRKDLETAGVIKALDAGF